MKTELLEVILLSVLSLTVTEIPASPEEMGWKDNVTVLPGYISKFVMRVAPTDRPVNAPPADLMFPFDPSLGPGYVWHCHVIDHEDMSMMRPLEIHPSPLRAYISTDHNATCSENSLCR